MDWEKIARSGSDDLPNDTVALITTAIDHYHSAIHCLEKALDTIDAERQARSVKRSWNHDYGRVR